MIKVNQLIYAVLVTILLISSTGCSSKEPQVIIKDNYIPAKQYPFEIVTLEGSYQELKPIILKNVILVDGILQSKAKSPIYYIGTEGNDTTVSAKGVQRICTESLYQNDMIHKKPFNFMVEQVQQYNDTFKTKDNNDNRK